VYPPLAQAFATDWWLVAGGGMRGEVHGADTSGRRRVGHGSNDMGSGFLPPNAVYREGDLTLLS
jgi:hypothetical protein